MTTPGASEGERRCYPYSSQNQSESLPYYGTRAPFRVDTHLDSGDHEGGGVGVRPGVAAGQHPGAHVPQDKVLVRERPAVDRDSTRAVVSLRCCGGGGGREGGGGEGGGVCVTKGRGAVGLHLLVPAALEQRI